MLKRFVLLLFSIAIITSAHDHPNFPCNHDKIDLEPVTIQMPEDSSENSRILATYENIRIHFDFSSKKNAL